MRIVCDYCGGSKVRVRSMVSGSVYLFCTLACKEKYFKGENDGILPKVRKLTARKTAGGIDIVCGDL